MKLLLINSIGRSKWGGGEKWMVMAAKNLIQRGHSVHIACTPNSVVEKNSLAEGVPVLRVNIHSDLSIGAFFKLRKFIVKDKTNVIIGCQNRDVRLAGLITKKVLHSSTVVLSRQGVQLLSNSVKYKLSFVPMCDGIITNTLSIKNEYDSYGWWDKDFVKVLYNGVESELKDITPFDYKKYLPAEENNPIIVLSTGRITEQKGFKYLIDSAKEILKQHKNIYFFIAGKGKLEKDLVAQINALDLKDHVFLIGFQKNIPALLKGANLFVLPSLYEGMPNSVMEAMAYGLPVVSTDVNGVSELMIDKKHGRIIPSKNVNAITDSVCEVLSEGNFDQVGGEGRRHVEENFTIHKMTENLEFYLLDKIAKNNSTRK